MKILVLLALTACATEPDLAEIDQEVGCSKWGCGTNSPVITDYLFHESNTDHLPNLEDITLLKMRKSDGTEGQARITADQLSVVNDLGVTIATGAALQGWYFLFQLPNGQQAKLHIDHVTPKATSPVHFWVGPPTQIETYELAYTLAGPVGYNPPHVPLCQNPPARASGEGATRTWESRFEAILYTGDRYDADAKTVTTIGYPATTGWFNIACAGSVLAKLHLTRHTTPGVVRPYYATQTQRQAMLKMYVADVCGTGEPTTVQGTPLHWENTYGWSTLDGTESFHEAFWGPQGAVCLDHHRLGTTVFSCQPSPCPPGPIPPGAYLTTAVP